MSDAQKRAYIIADNQIARNSEWDEELLASQLEDLSDQGFDLETLGISVTAFRTIQTPPEHTATNIRKLERETDSAPTTEEAFEKEMASKSAGLLPIVPIYAEHHEAFIICCDNAVDEAWLRNKLGLETPRQSYKDIKAQRANIITVAQLRERLR